MASREPLPRWRHAAVGVGNELYVWGGDSSVPIAARIVEIFDLPSVTWKDPFVLPCSDIPESLWGMAVASDVQSSYSFGGVSGRHSNFTRYNNIYKVTPSHQLCEELQPTSPSHTAPEETSGSCVVQLEDKLVIYGGHTGERRTNDLHVFDLKERVWAAQPTTGDKPPPLTRHTFTKIDHHRAVVFGGHAGSRTNDTYVLDMKTWHWPKLKITGGKPPARYHHTTCYIAGPLTGQQYPQLMVIGGYGGYRGVLGDVWLLDVDRGMWSEITLPVAITPRYGHSATVFESGANFRVVVLFGGYDDVCLSETTLLFLELRRDSWKVTRVVKQDELERPDERLREQMRMLELSPQEGSDGAVEQSLGEEQEKTNQAQPLERSVTELQTQNSVTDDVVSPSSPRDTSSPKHTGEWMTETDSAAATTPLTDSAPTGGRREDMNKSCTTDPAAATISNIHNTPTSTIDPADLKYSDEQLGGGAHGVVWKGIWKGKEVAIKKCLQLDPKDVHILQQLGAHPNIIALYGVVVDRESMFCSIVTELVKGGSLYNFLHKGQKKTLSDEQKYSWMKGIAEGMLFLHSKGLAHRDLKSGNILLAGDNLMTPKLCDFGTARQLDHTTAQSTMTGTYRWMAPEVMKDDNALINQKCDVFSYSMVLCEIVTQQLPFNNVKSDKLAMFELLQQKRPALPPSDAECPLYLRHLIIACWDEDSHKRPPFQEICQALEKRVFP